MPDTSITPQPTMDATKLRAMSRAQLQRLAVANKIKANGKSESIIAQLLEVHPDGVPEFMYLRALAKPRQFESMSPGTLFGQPSNKKTTNSEEVPAEAPEAGARRSKRLSIKTRDSPIPGPSGSGAGPSHRRRSALAPSPPNPLRTPLRPRRRGPDEYSPDVVAAVDKMIAEMEAEHKRKTAEAQRGPTARKTNEVLRELSRLATRASVKRDLNKLLKVEAGISETLKASARTLEYIQHMRLAVQNVVLPRWSKYEEDIAIYMQRRAMRESVEPSSPGKRQREDDEDEDDLYGDLPAEEDTGASPAKRSRIDQYDI